MATKTTKKAAKKAGRGGARKGAGRKAYKPEEKVSRTKFIRCSSAVDDAFNDFIERKNAERTKLGLSPVSFSRWAREVLLVAAGRADLTEAANPVDEAAAAE